MIAYVFDVDGTLTPSRLPMNQEFSQFFTNWSRDKKVFFVTGSNSYKTTETFQNNQMNTLVSLVIVILIILFLCLIYNGKHKWYSRYVTSYKM